MPPTNAWTGFASPVGSVAVDFEQWNYSNSVVGCVISTNKLWMPFIFGVTNASQSLTSGEGAIVTLGCSSPGAVFGQPPVDPVPGQSTYWHGNYDPVNNGIVWNANNSYHTIPSSLYLLYRPAWWGATPWPAIGPDLTNMVSLIPAQMR